MQSTVCRFCLVFYLVVQSTACFWAACIFSLITDYVLKRRKSNLLLWKWLWIICRVGLVGRGVGGELGRSWVSLRGIHPLTPAPRHDMILHLCKDQKDLDLQANAKLAHSGIHEGRTQEVPVSIPTGCNFIFSQCWGVLELLNFGQCVDVNT